MARPVENSAVLAKLGLANVVLAKLKMEPWWAGSGRARFENSQGKVLSGGKEAAEKAYSVGA